MPDMPLVLAPQTRAAPVAPVAPVAPWPAPARVAFRFALAFYVFQAPPFEPLQDRLGPWLGVHLLGLPGPIQTAFTGSSDRTVDWIWLGFQACGALLASLVWTALARAPAYPRLHAWLRVYLRFLLGWAMLSYGAAKLFKTQFPTPSTLALLQTYGESSPMRLLWTLMGASLPYNLFTGGAEVLGGLLLFARRTTTLGALVVAGAMTNVVMLNLSYDVPVKIGASLLLLQALVLLAPDLPRLLDSLVRGRATVAPALVELFESPRLRLGARVVRGLAVAAVLWSTLGESWQYLRAVGDEHPGPLAGFYEVEEFRLSGALVAPGEGPQAARCWSAAELTGQFFFLRRPGETGRYLFTAFDEAKERLTLTERPKEGGKVTFDLRAKREGTERLLLEGNLSGEAIAVRLHRVPPPKLLLRERGFHWVNETPFNR